MKLLTRCNFSIFPASCLLQLATRGTSSLGLLGKLIWLRTLSIHERQYTVNRLATCVSDGLLAVSKSWLMYSGEGVCYIWKSSFQWSIGWSLLTSYKFDPHSSDQYTKNQCFLLQRSQRKLLPCEIIKFIFTLKDECLSSTEVPIGVFNP